MVCSLLAQEKQNTVIYTIDFLLEEELRKENVKNVFLSLYSPSRNFEWSTAKGSFKDGRKVTTSNPYFTASVGKTFTATAIGILVDRGKIQFNDPIAEYLSADIMDGLHVLNGVDYSDSITVAHLLQHTSGLADYFDDTTRDGSPTMFDLIMMEPHRFWQPEDLVAFAKAHFEPSFAPGTGYTYTDTEYILLGMIIEKISGMKFHEFLAKNIFVPLKMNQTYLNQRSKAIEPTGNLAEMYAGEYEISTFRSLSADWAGGAVVSTGSDLIAFQEALMNGKLVSLETLNNMQQWTEESKGMAYGFGLRKISLNELDPTLPNWALIGHSGLNGTSMYYCPDLDIYLTGTLNQLEVSRDAVILMVKVMMQVAGL
ncbi:MAG: beta-lactamase family protein [Ekhidna sp.]|nr:beta-lactamase family protein [Ekhidna sp.]